MHTFWELPVINNAIINISGVFTQVRVTGDKLLFISLFRKFKISLLAHREKRQISICVASHWYNYLIIFDLTPNINYYIFDWINTIWQMFDYCQNLVVRITNAMNHELCIWNTFNVTVFWQQIKANSVVARNLIQIK